MLGDRIVMAHAKDRRADGSFAAAGSGVIDFRHFVRSLRDAGFDGPLVDPWAERGGGAGGRRLPARRGRRGSGRMSWLTLERGGARLAGSRRRRRTAGRLPARARRRRGAGGRGVSRRRRVSPPDAGMPRPGPIVGRRCRRATRSPLSPTTCWPSPIARGVERFVVGGISMGAAIALQDRRPPSRTRSSAWCWRVRHGCGRRRPPTCGRMREVAAHLRNPDAQQALADFEASATAAETGARSARQSRLDAEIPRRRRPRRPGRAAVGHIRRRPRRQRGGSALDRRSDAGDRDMASTSPIRWPSPRRWPR